MAPLPLAQSALPQASISELTPHEREPWFAWGPDSLDLDFCISAGTAGSPELKVIHLSLWCRVSDSQDGYCPESRVLTRPHHPHGARKSNWLRTVAPGPCAQVAPSG